MAETICIVSSDEIRRVEEATDDLLRVLNSHNTRLRPSFEPDITDRPCSDFLFNEYKTCSKSTTPKLRPVSPIVTNLLSEAPLRDRLSSSSSSSTSAPFHAQKPATDTVATERRESSLSLSPTPPHSPPSSGSRGRRSLPVYLPRVDASTSSRSQSPSRDFRAAAAAAAASDRAFFHSIAPLPEPGRSPSAGFCGTVSVPSGSTDASNGSGKTPSVAAARPRRRRWERLLCCFGSKARVGSSPPPRAQQQPQPPLRTRL